MNDTEKAHLYERALYHLASSSRRWNSNLNRFRKWDFDRRLSWIDYIECEAKRDLHMAKEIIAKVIELRIQK